MITKKKSNKIKAISKKKKRSSRELLTQSTEETVQFLEKITGGPLTLGRAISAIRECDEISQGEFAKKLGVSQSYLCDLENDRKIVSPKKAAEFARILEDSEILFVTLAIDDMLVRQGLPYKITLEKAA